MILRLSNSIRRAEGRNAMRHLVGRLMQSVLIALAVALIVCAAALAGTAASCVVLRIENSSCYAQFYGVNDPSTDRIAWESNRTDMGLAVANTALGYPDVTIQADIPGEERSGVHSPALAIPGNDLYTLLALNNAPSELFGSQGNGEYNVYARVTPRFESVLLGKILASSGNLSPAEVLSLALDSVKEKTGVASYPLAVLTAHNLLKNAAMLGRTAISDAQNAETKLPANPSDAVMAYTNKKVAGYTNTLCRWSRLIGKLASLRADPAGSKDKIGPWYHGFAILTVGALINGSTSRLVTLAEHGGKAVNLFSGEGGFNAEKFSLDTEFAATAIHIDNGGLHRPKSFAPLIRAAAWSGNDGATSAAADNRSTQGVRGSLGPASCGAPPPSSASTTTTTTAADTKVTITFQGLSETRDQKTDAANPPHWITANVQSGNTYGGSVAVSGPLPAGYTVYAEFAGAIVAVLGPTGGSFSGVTKPQGFGASTEVGAFVCKTGGSVGQPLPSQCLAEGADIAVQWSP
jgi:hypothetical protein